MTRAPRVTFAALVGLAGLAAGCGRQAPITDETRAREGYARDLAEREGLLDAWALTSRSDLQFDDGFAGVELVDPLARGAWWDDAVRACASGRAQPVRWMGARGHLRVRGTGDHRLRLRGWADVSALQTRPTISASFDGAELHAAVVDDHGYFQIDATIPGGWLAGADWSDIYLVSSSVDNPFRDPAGKLSTTRLTVLRLEGATWTAIAQAPGAP